MVLPVRLWYGPALLFIFLACICLTIPAYGAAAASDLQGSGSDTIPQEYKLYRQRLDRVKHTTDLAAQGFDIVENQIFPLTMEGGRVLSLIPAYDKTYNRLVLFLADPTGEITFKTDQLETNDQRLGKLRQPNQRVAAVSFQDMNGDGLTDIVLITTCVNESGVYVGRPYKVGDMLFQRDGTFYRDYRLSDNLNRFSMNKSIRFISSFVRDGYSTEFLYTASTEKELLDHGFQIYENRVFTCFFEKIGRLTVVPGVYRMAEYTVFMVYLVNEDGSIAWSFQPMGDYESLYGLQGIFSGDIDGDGLTDILVLASYTYEDSRGESVVERDYSVYYQRTGGFYEDRDIKKTVLCSDNSKLSELAESLRLYWGWEAEP